MQGPPKNSRRTFGTAGVTFFQDGYDSCHQSNSVKDEEEKQLLQ